MGTIEQLFNSIHKIDKIIKEGLLNADVFLITLGYIEVWRKKNDGRFTCMHPGYDNNGSGFAESEFHLSSFQENRDNLVKIAELIRSVNKSAKIVFTVSPIPLGMTFTGDDVVVANMESKSLLKTAVAEVCRAFDNVFYFPSYEICCYAGNCYIEDGRHVEQETIKKILALFLASYSKT